VGKAHSDDCKLFLQNKFSRMSEGWHIVLTVWCSCKSKKLKKVLQRVKHRYIKKIHHYVSFSFQTPTKNATITNSNHEKNKGNNVKYFFRQCQTNVNNRLSMDKSITTLQLITHSSEVWHLKTRKFRVFLPRGANTVFFFFCHWKNMGTLNGHLTKISFVYKKKSS